jgi:hypothetical protein
MSIKDTQESLGRLLDCADSLEPEDRLEFFDMLMILSAGAIRAMAGEEYLRDLLIDAIDKLDDPADIVIREVRQ